jgi:hypothetical protein
VVYTKGRIDNPAEAISAIQAKKCIFIDHFSAICQVVADVLNNQTSLLLKTALLYRRYTLGFHTRIIDVPYHFRK